MNHNYDINDQRWIILVFFVAVLFLPVRINEQLLTTVLYVKIFYLVLLLVFMLLRFSLEIENGMLEYRICLFGIVIYKKSVSVNQIERFIFKRVSWSQKCVVIKVYKGWNFRVVSKNQEIYTQLQKFANDNQLKFIKTNDYKILENKKGNKD